MGGCQNYGPFLGTLDIRCRIIIGIQKGTITLTTTQILTILDILIYYASCYGCYVHFVIPSRAPVPNFPGLVSQDFAAKPTKARYAIPRLLGNILHLVRNKGHVHA